MPSSPIFSRFIKRKGGCVGLAEDPKHPTTDGETQTLLQSFRAKANGFASQRRSGLQMRFAFIRVALDIKHIQGGSFNAPPSSTSFDK
jgi:hypothetical protein